MRIEIIRGPVVPAHISKRSCDAGGSSRAIECLLMSTLGAQVWLRLADESRSNLGAQVWLRLADDYKVADEGQPVAPTAIANPAQEG